MDFRFTVKSILKIGDTDQTLVLNSRRQTVNLCYNWGSNVFIVFKLFCFRLLIPGSSDLSAGEIKQETEKGLYL